MQANYIPDSSTLTLEIAHVLFMDVVAYSQLTMEEQTRIIQLLQRIVRNTAAFDNAQKHRRLLRLPTGDGMALVFFGDAAAPVRCAMQISQALREQTDLKLRMGINTGQVQRVADINAARDVAGGGINVAQRVMDCGDAGHILVSKTAADVLDQAGKWKPALHDLGEAEVKHGVCVHLYNLYTEEAGNPELPQKLRTARTAAATILSRSKRKRLSLEAIGIGVIAAIVAGGFYFRSHHTKPLTEEDTIVLAEFDNKTGDPAFDDALKQALAVQLGQSPFLNILSDQRVSETLRMMGRPANERITADVGGEICQRTGSTAVIGWTITSWGSHYLIDLNAVACSTGDTLAKEQSEAAGKENVLKALSRASSSLRAKLGESLPSVQKFDIPVEATTSSLEALKNYSMGVRKQQEKGDAPSIPFYKRAIELDPNFPMAYDELSVRYYNLGQPSLALKYATKAYQLRDKVTDREKLHISADYFSATGELDKEEQTYELWITSYPRDSIPHG